ncbi:hypothetical protein [Sphingomonas crocodyli]|uniref:Restriction endonuclease type IV Mrr domain-containing protein n=1 Tax=Sphingomonas crocodyli TaxID=1979270 RepID=A0A437M604_9SPHN|nr:hypothetical protein [Sphingomonas crocodyli]RVT93087.1 hypothetical protein EOD43_04095 [Sphingomonas crocodyli]
MALQPECVELHIAYIGAERVRAYRELDPSLGKPILVVFSELSSATQAWAQDQYDIEIWDVDILRERAAQFPELANRFEALTGSVTDEPVPQSAEPITHKLQSELTEHVRDNVLTPTQYEELCMRVFMHLFDPDLYGFAKQASTSDGANRYDFICRIRPGNPFWDGLRADFRTKAILFECKNYEGQISADQVYSTEGYLFVGALRTVCLLISRLPAKDSAIRAAQGAMRESGKLILLLSNEDLIQMLELRSQAGAAENYLDKKIWDFVISLPR